ncbi:MULTISPECIES: VOC family protein [unclassified Rhodococcus (in: high G+C Gram-positive bacteria)]|uniref:VOC family protein n=1 Tax=Rhodococcus sp. SJ-3 TaxID=3454628 RepID=UPI003F797D76
MTTRLNPYISFRDNARDAIEFYKTVFGGELDISTFGEGQPTGDAAVDSKVMHAMLTTDSGFVLMASDTPPGMDHTPGNNYSISLSGDDESELRGYWNELVAGGTEALPLEKAPWGDSFGMCIDKFGVQWMVNISGSPD